MKKSSKFSRLRLNKVENVAPRSPIAKFFTPTTVVESSAPASPERLDVTDMKELEEDPPSINRRPREPIISSKDFVEAGKSFKKPPVPRASSKRAKKQPDIRKILKINPELDFKDEEKLQRMILQKSREENLNADDLQIALALSRSLGEQNRSSPNKKAVEFFEMMGMATKPRKRTRKGNKTTLLTRRDPGRESEKIAGRIEEIVSSTCPAQEGASGCLAHPFPICSCYLFDIRVDGADQRIMQVNCQAQEANRYYIKTNLFPESSLAAGHLLRDWRKIPGRSPSPEGHHGVVVAEGAASDPLDLEIEKQLEEINKQSEAFLQNFEWREKSASPDLFGDLSASTNSIVMERQMVLPLDNGHIPQDSEDVHRQKEPVDPKETIKAAVENPQNEIVTNNSQDEMEAQIDLTQDSEHEEGDVELLEESPMRSDCHPNSPKEDSIEAVLAKARSLIRELAGEDDRGRKTGSQENNTIVIIDDHQEVNEPARVSSSQRNRTAEKSVESGDHPEGSICILDSSDEEVMGNVLNNGHQSPAHPTPSTSTLNVVDWSKDRFSLENLSAKDSELSSPQTKKRRPMESAHHESSHSGENLSGFNDFHMEADGGISGGCTADSEDVVNLCDEEEDEGRKNGDEEVEEVLDYLEIENQLDAREEIARGADRRSSPESLSWPGGLLHQQLSIKPCIEPPPDYKAMPLAKLKRELDKFGIKRSLPPNKAVKLLAHIYSQLHPLIAAEVDLVDLQVNPSNEMDLMRHLEQTLGVEPVVDDDEPRLEIPPPEKPPTKGGRSKAKATCELSVEVAFKNRLLFDSDYHEQVLRYIPIDLKELMAFFKSIGFKVGCNRVIDYLDAECITYKTVEPIENQQRRTAAGSQGGRSTVSRRGRNA